MKVKRIIWRSELMAATGWTKRYFKILVKKGKLAKPDISPTDGRNGKEPGWCLESLPDHLKKRIEHRAEGTGEKKEAEAKAATKGYDAADDLAPVIKPPVPGALVRLAQAPAIAENRPDRSSASSAEPGSGPTCDVSKTETENQCIPGQKDEEILIPEKLLHVANLRADLIRSLQEDLSSNGRSKTKILQQFLDAYNLGLILPQVFGQIGKISRSTLYEWLKAMNEGGVKALAPQYGGAGVCKITEEEKNAVLGLLLNQNKIKVNTAIRMAKYSLQKRQIKSPSSSTTLCRWVNEFKKNHFDIWTLFREGEKALNDKVLPYIERDRELLQVGEGLVADGHRLNFNVINPFTGKPCRPALIMFWDWRSSYPLGWEIMLLF